MKIDGRTLDHKTLEHLRITAVRRVVEDHEAPPVVMESILPTRPKWCGPMSSP